VKRVLIAAGGTGGHFYPGLVAALELKKRGWEPLLIVKKNDPARERLEQAGLACLEVDLVGMPRKMSGFVSFAGKLCGSMRMLSRVARDFKPDLVLGMGGYLTFPVAYAAWRRGIPIALHESNAVLGLANDASRRLGGTMFWGLPPVNGGNGNVVGTPIRPALYAHKDQAKSREKFGLDPEKKTILVFGGSQGAKAINEGMPKAMKTAGVDAQVLHLAGKGNSSATINGYADAGVRATVLDYLDDMAAAYAAADIVVCRSGASTLAELAALRKTAVLVPYPHAAANHQDANARVFENKGTARRIPETDLHKDLGPVLADLLESPIPESKFNELGLPPAAATTTAFIDHLEKLL
jgi:UDP-N-acetylglucosamine--N-acetylmuramyl-(pentapeptide) pyrophosphoryl-undecaprenol N-acetylglucosamine transferase